MAYQIFANNDDAEGWSLGGCWGSENGVCETETEAQSCCDWLANQWQETTWGYAEILDDDEDCVEYDCVRTWYEPPEEDEDGGHDV